MESMMSTFLGLRGGALALVLGLSTLTAAYAGAPGATVQYQPMVSTGLAANQPFEAWFVLDKSSDPRMPGYAIPAGATIRFVFPKEFTPKPGLFQGAVMLPGWVQGPIAANFTTTQAPTNPRAIIIKFNAPITADPPGHPGLKDIHIRARVVNPAPGNYPISITFSDAGALNGTTTAIARITPSPVPNIAAYNELNEGKGSNWQHVQPSQEAPVPIDFLVTLPNVPRSVISLSAQPDGSLKILSDGKPIGSIKASGAPVTMRPVSFGPGKSRLGIIRINVKAGNEPGMAEITAALDAGTEYKINLAVDASSKVTGK
jgi:hypothetical protein